MDVIFVAATHALEALFTPLRMAYLLCGVFLGLLVGLIPGLGGIVGLSLLLPFTYNLDPASAMALLMGMAAAVSHGDVIPAVLFGVPGTVGCAATVLDGYPMAKRGEAGRALGAAFNASLLGGLFGALLLALTIPIIRPFILLFGSPEMVAICIFGMSLVASLSGNAPLKGLAAGAVGLLLSMVGADSQTETMRFTFGSLYLWDGIPIVPVALGVFAIPELCDLMIERTSIAPKGRIDARAGQWQGWKDAWGSWFLVIRTSALGAVCSMVPGLGASVIDWIAYGHALRTEKGASETFGKGDVRGVIAAEASTNARQSGSLVPTIAFGVPAHASMAILLGAFLIQGIVPGPDMLSKHLDVTYTIVWSLTLANIFGTVICFALANQFARVATVHYAILLPLVMTLVFLGAFQGQHGWGDIVTLLLLGSFSWVMKSCGWPRPPLVLGFILGSMIERYTFISVERYDWSWLGNWFVILMLAMAVIGIVLRMRGSRGVRLAFAVKRPRLTLGAGLTGLVLALFVAALFFEARWPFAARLVPQIVSALGVAVSLFLLLAELFGAPAEAPPLASAPIEMPGEAVLPPGIRYPRALEYFAWVYGALLVAYLIGLMPGLVVFVFAFLRLHGRRDWRVVVPLTAAIALFIWGVFDRIVHETWPTTVVGDLFPQIRTVLPWF